MENENKPQKWPYIVAGIVVFILIGIIVYLTITSKHDYDDLKGKFDVIARDNDSLRKLTNDQKQTINSADEDQKSAVVKTEHETTVKYVYQKHRDEVAVIDCADVNQLIRIYTGQLNRKPLPIDTARRDSLNGKGSNRSLARPADVPGIRN